jgi:galactokinase
LQGDDLALPETAAGPTGDRVLAALLAAFSERFGREPELGALAPGRVNLIGEHTDYTGGLVLPCAIDRETVVVAAPRADGEVHVFSDGWPGVERFGAAAPARRGTWVDYVQGPFAALLARGVVPGGLDLGVASRVPAESGLSSSAALEVATAFVVARAAGFAAGAETLARVAHEAETRFVGVACGIMDPFASALGRAGHALRIDCRTEDVRAVPLAREVTLLIAASGARRKLAAGGYAQRVAECAEALTGARSAGLGRSVESLRDLVAGDLPALERVLPAVLFRRARHVVTENARVDAFCAALERGDADRAGSLLRAGMASLRDDFEVSIPELDFLCEAADAQAGCFGSRLTGAGWGGCTLHWVAPASAATVAEGIADAFQDRFGRRPPILPVTPSEGARLLRRSELTR